MPRDNNLSQRRYPPTSVEAPSLAEESASTSDNHSHSSGVSFSHLVHILMLASYCDDNEEKDNIPQRIDAAGFGYSLQTYLATDGYVVCQTQECLTAIAIATDTNW